MIDLKIKLDPATMRAAAEKALADSPEARRTLNALVARFREPHPIPDAAAAMLKTAVVPMFMRRRARLDYLLKLCGPATPRTPRTETNGHAR